MPQLGLCTGGLGILIIIRHASYAYELQGLPSPSSNPTAAASGPYMGPFLCNFSLDFRHVCLLCKLCAK